MCIVTMKTMTNALRAKGALIAKGIPADVIHLDPSVTARGCAYGVSFSCGDSDGVRNVLDSKGIAFGEWIGGGRSASEVSHDIS